MCPHCMQVNISNVQTLKIAAKAYCIGTVAADTLDHKCPCDQNTLLSLLEFPCNKRGRNFCCYEFHYGLAHEKHIVMYEVLQKCMWYNEVHETGLHVYKYIPRLVTLLDSTVTGNGEPSVLKLHLQKLLL